MGVLTLLTNFVSLDDDFKQLVFLTAELGFKLFVDLVEHRSLFSETVDFGSKDLVASNSSIIFLLDLI